jgi:hypothetical protein
MPRPAPAPVHVPAPSTEGLPFAKPPRHKRERSGGITVRADRAKETEEKRFGPYADLIRACPCAAAYPEMYATDEAIRLTLLTAAREVYKANPLGKKPPRRSAPHHTVKCSQGGLAHHMIPVRHALHDESHLHGDPNAFLATKGIPDALALAALIWSVHEEIRQELERVERGR